MLDDEVAIGMLVKASCGCEGQVVAVTESGRLGNLYTIVKTKMGMYRQCHNKRGTYQANSLTFLGPAPSEPEPDRGLQKTAQKYIEAGRVSVDNENRSLRQVVYEKPKPKPVAVPQITQANLLGLIAEGWIESRRDMDGQYSRCRRCRAEGRGKVKLVHTNDCIIGQVLS